ncbi:helix-turn-helix domain-containing protein [Mucilaginibacter paludis]|nr:AraC family transcriptional regulator [Mucilaginibacter paludis]
MKGLLPLTHMEECTLLRMMPASLRSYVPGWTTADAEICDYSFGVITSPETTDKKGNAYTCRISQMERRERFITVLDAGTYFIHIRLKGDAKVNLMAEEDRVMSGRTIAVLYLPPGKIISELCTGIGGSLLIRINPVIEQYAIDSHMRQLLDQARQCPHEPFLLPVVGVDFWLGAIVNLLMNNGKHKPYNQDLYSLLDRLIRLYLNELKQDIPPDHKNKLQLQVLTGARIGKSKLVEGSAAFIDYHHIIQYLEQHLKYNYDKREIALKSELTVKQFTRLFEDGYGKSYQDGYIELRMIQALRLTVADVKLSQIATAIGYHNFGSFSKAFRKFFGYPASLLQWPYYNNEIHPDI